MMTEVFQTLKNTHFSASLRNGSVIPSLKGTWKGKPSHGGVDGGGGGGGRGGEMSLQQRINVSSNCFIQSFTSYSFSCPHIINITIMVSSICCYFSCIFVIFSLLFFLCYFSLSSNEYHPQRGALSSLRNQGFVKYNI